MTSNYPFYYQKIDFRKHPERYVIGRGEQGVLIAEPYKSEILPHWRFKTPEIAQQSAAKIFEMYKQYKQKNEFVGMDMARKFLQMGFTRSRRYANHPDGKKYFQGKIIPQDENSELSLKAKSAKIFYGYYRKVMDDEVYKYLKQDHLKLEKIAYKNPKSS